MKVGYIRVSTLEQNTARQLESQVLDKVFTDKASGKSRERPELKALLEFIRLGDTIVVHSMDRLARNLDDLRAIVKDLVKRGVRIAFLKENLIFTDDNSAMSNLLLSVMGAFAEFERDLIRERQAEGIALAKQRGVYKGRKKSLNADQIAQIRARAHGENKTALAKEFGVCRDTIYECIK